MVSWHTDDSVAGCPVEFTVGSKRPSGSWTVSVNCRVRVVLQAATVQLRAARSYRRIHMEQTSATAERWPIWVMFDQYGSCLTNMGHVWPIWVMFDQCGSRLTNVGHVWPMWVTFDQCGSCLTNMGHVWPIWVMFDQYGPCLISDSTYCCTQCVNTVCGKYISAHESSLIHSFVLNSLIYCWKTVYKTVECQYNSNELQ